MRQFSQSEIGTERTPNWLDVRDVKWSLRPAWRTFLFLAPIIAGAAYLIWDGIRVSQVTYQVNTVSVTDIKKAIQRDPANADLIHRLGVVQWSNPADIDLNESLKNLRQAVVLNPRRWDYWLDLGTGCDSAGDRAGADEAFARALALNPMTPATQWALANHYLLTDRQEMAFPYFHRLLEMDPAYLGAVYRLCFRALRDPQAIYAGVVPKDKDASPRVAFLIFLLAADDYENAMRIWAQMLAGPDRTPAVAQIKPFLDLLIQKDRLAEAGTVWHDLQHAGVVPPGPPSPDGNLLFNGSFEQPPLNTGFDWRTSDSPELDFSFPESSAYEGAKCLRVDFVVGRNAEIAVLSQVVLVKPSTRYRLTAFVRSDNLNSESGPQLRMDEIGCQSCGPRTSEMTLGNTPWHPVEVIFLTSPQAQAVRVSLYRPQDHNYHSDITGKLWLDDVALRPLDVHSPEANSGRPR